MDVSISCHPTGTHWAYGATVRALMSILVWKRLELHCLVRVHFFAESQQMECCVWADLIFHTWNGTPVCQGEVQFIVIHCDERNNKQKGNQTAFTVHERKRLMQVKIFMYI